MKRAHGPIRHSRHLPLSLSRGLRRRLLFSLVLATLAALPGTAAAWEAHFGERDKPSAAAAVAFDGDRNVIAGGYALDLTVGGDGDVVVGAVLLRRGKTHAIVKLDGQNGRRRWVRPIDAFPAQLATGADDAIAIAGSKPIPIEWNDLGYGFWVGRLSTDGVGLSPTFLH